MRRAFLLFVAVVLSMAGQAGAITLVSAQDSLSATSASYALTLDFTDAQPASLAEVAAIRISLAGSAPDLAGRLSFAPGPDWDMPVAFGDGWSPLAADLSWSLLNPTTGLAPGASSTLGVLTIDLAGLGGQTVRLRFDGGSDPDADMTQVVGFDGSGEPVQLAAGFGPDEFRFRVPVGIPEPATAALGLLAAMALGWRRRLSPGPVRS